MVYFSTDSAKRSNDQALLAEKTRSFGCTLIEPSVSWFFPRPKEAAESMITWAFEPASAC
jgi:hypothetical protein